MNRSLSSTTFHDSRSESTSFYYFVGLSSASNSRQEAKKENMQSHIEQVLNYTLDLVNSNQVAGIKFDAHCFVRGLNSIIGYLGFPEPRQARRWNSVPRFFIVTLS